MLKFFEKINSIIMSQQPIWQIICNSCNKNNTLHTLKSLYIFLELNYKLIPWLKKFEKVFIIYLCGIRNFNTNKVQCGIEQLSQSVTRITSPKLHLLISYLLEDEFSFFSACWINIIIFICTTRISAKFHALLLSLFRVLGQLPHR